MCVLLSPVIWIRQLHAASTKSAIVDSIAVHIEGVGVITRMELVQYAALSSVIDYGYDNSIKKLKEKQFIKTYENKLIDRLLMLKDAQLLSIKNPGQTEVNNMIQDLKSMFPGEKYYNEFLKHYAITDAGLKKYMSDELILKQYIHDEISVLVNVNDTDIRDYYKNHITSFKGVSKEDAYKSIKQILHHKAYEKVLKSWIKTLKQHREIIILY